LLCRHRVRRHRLTFTPTRQKPAIISSTNQYPFQQDFILVLELNLNLVLFLCSLILI
jgi:hypothetical protein